MVEVDAVIVDEEDIVVGGFTLPPQPPRFEVTCALAVPLPFRPFLFPAPTALRWEEIASSLSCKYTVTG